LFFHLRAKGRWGRRRNGAEAERSDADAEMKERAKEKEKRKVKERAAGEEVEEDHERN
jgi:hypothetical protein